MGFCEDSLNKISTYCLEQYQAVQSTISIMHSNIAHILIILKGLKGFSKVQQATDQRG